MKSTAPRKHKTAPSLVVILTIAFLTSSVLMLAITSALQLLYGIKTQKDVIAADQQLIAQYAATSVSGFVQDKFNILETAIWLTNPYAASPEQQKLMLDSLLGLQPAFIKLALLNAGDKVLVEATRLPLSGPWLTRDRLNGPVLAGIQQKKRFISSIYIDSITSEPMVIMAAPVIDVFGAYRGSLVVEVNLKFMWDLVARLKVHLTGYAYVVDRRGTLIAFQDTTRVLKGENVGGVKAIDGFLHGDSAAAPAAGVTTYRGITGTQVVGTFVPLGTPDWAVVTELPWGEAYREVLRQAWVSLGITLAMAALASILGVYLARRLSVPLVNLMETATHIAEGKRELQAMVGGPREVARLAVSFNSMTAQLRQSLESLERQVVEVRQAEQSLRRANETLQALIDYSPLAIIMLDLEGHVVLWNNAAERMYGWTAREALGQFVPFIPEGSREDQRRIHERVAGGEVLTNLELERKCKDGSTILNGVSLSPLRDAAGSVYALMSVATDITERKKAEEALRKSEERFRSLVETTSDWVWEVDCSGVYTYASPRVKDVLGYEPEEILGRTPFDLMTAEEAASVRSRFKDAMGSQKPFERLENTNRHKDGRLVVMETSGVPVFGQDGTVSGFRGIDRDITEVKKAQEEQRRLQEQLQQAIKMEAVGQLAGGIAHDFNNLLTAIIGNIDIARMSLESTNPSIKYLNEIDSASQSAAALTRQLLTFARRQMVQPKVFNLNDLVPRFQNMLTHLLGEDIALENALDKELGNVRVDPVQVEQVLVNLATNARAAMPDGGRLLIETSNVWLDEDYCARHAQAHPGRYVLLAVSDTGHGMSDEVKAHIFEPFFTTKPMGQGTGLGLATVFGIVKQAGGTIEVYSEEGQGTQFKIYLPRIEEKPEEPVKESSSRELPTGHQTILVVEDNDSVRQSAVKTLERLHYKVLSPPTVAEVPDFVASYKERIDLLMTDVVMPGITGPELADRLHALHPEMKILFTSGYTQNVIAHHGVVEEKLNFIAKPYSIQALAVKIKTVLESEAPGD